MSKHIKIEILAIKEIIMKYSGKIPLANKPKFEKDLNMIFQDLDNTVDYDSLEQIKNLAKTRLLTLKRLYGDIDLQNQESIKKKVEDDIIRLSKIKVKISPDKEEIKVNDPSAKILEEYQDDKFFDDIKNVIKDLERHQSEFQNHQAIDKSNAFNKSKIEEFRKQNDELNLKLFNILKEKKESEKKKSQTNLTGDMVKNIVSEVIKSNKMDEKALENFDFENFAKHANLNNLDNQSPLNFLKNATKEDHERMKQYEENNTKLQEGPLPNLDEEPSPEEKERIKEMLSKELKKDDENFDVEGEKIFKNIRSEDQFNKILENKEIKLELTEQNLQKDLPEIIKQRIINYEKWKAENEIIRQEVDGEIKLDNYGSIEFKFYETDDEEDSAEKTGKGIMISFIRNVCFQRRKDGQGKSKKKKSNHLF
jgi:hypothetical protein